MCDLKSIIIIKKSDNSKEKYNKSHSNTKNNNSSKYHQILPIKIITIKKCINNSINKKIEYKANSNKLATQSNRPMQSSTNKPNKPKPSSTKSVTPKLNLIS